MGKLVGEIAAFIDNEVPMKWRYLAFRSSLRTLPTPIFVWSVASR
ncbi:MAG: hypothetical protein OSB76_01530 [Alphaproteobacteria bacterium]|nr:hypothetical protein [Alphaproteobacteria bacterium]